MNTLSVSFLTQGEQTAGAVMSRLTASGSVTTGTTTIDVRRASAYHDHNWGRWHWGDDVGWEWGAFMAESPGPAIVISRGPEVRAP